MWSLCQRLCSQTRALTSAGSLVSQAWNSGFSTSSPLQEIRKMARMRVVDNSALGRAAAASGKPARVIHVYNKKGVGMLGDKVLVTIKGKKKKALIVGLKQQQQPGIPRFDTNNIVLVEDSGDMTGTRVNVPVPLALRGRVEFVKILSLAKKLV